MRKLAGLAWIITGISTAGLCLAGVKLEWIHLSWQGDCLKIILIESLIAAYIFTAISIEKGDK